MAVRVEAFGDSVRKYGEELCGDRVEIVRDGAGVTAMLADGMGGGIEANVLSSLAVKMMSTLLGRRAPVEEIAGMIAESQPAGREEGVSHSAFTIIQVSPGGAISLAQMETPDVLLFRRGKPVGPCADPSAGEPGQAPPACGVELRAGGYGRRRQRRRAARGGGARPRKKLADAEYFEIFVSGVFPRHPPGKAGPPFAERRQLALRSEAERRPGGGRREDGKR